jgi:hypothetical protein
MQEQYYINWSVHTGKYKVYKIKLENPIECFDKKSDAEHFIKELEKAPTIIPSMIVSGDLGNIEIVDDGEWSIHFTYKGDKYRMAMCCFSPRIKSFCKITNSINFEEFLQDAIKELEMMVKNGWEGGDGLYKIN